MIVQDMYEGARTRVKRRVGITDMIPLGVGLHQGSSPSPYLFAMIMDVLARGKWGCWKETRRVEKGYGRERVEDQQKENCLSEVQCRWELGWKLRNKSTRDRIWNEWIHLNSLERHWQRMETWMRRWCVEYNQDGKTGRVKGKYTRQL